MFVLLILLMFLVSFALAAAMGYLWTKRGDRSTARYLQPSLGTRVWIRWQTESAVCRFVGLRPEGWLLSAPRRKGSPLLVQSDDVIRIEFGSSEGVVRCHSRVVLQDLVEDTIVVTLPRVTSVEERRAARRTVGGQICSLNGCDSTLVDVSEGGAKVLGVCNLAAGDTVRLEWNGTAQYGWVLQVVPTTSSKSASEVRISFTA